MKRNFWFYWVIIYLVVLAIMFFGLEVQLKYFGQFSLILLAIFLVFSMPVKYILIPQMKEGPSIKETSRVVLNKSEFSGVSYLNIMIAILFLVGVIYSAFEKVQNDRAMPTVYSLILFFVVVILVTKTQEYLSFQKLQKTVVLAGEEVKSHIYGQFQFTKGDVVKLEFSKLNLNYVDVVLVLTTSKTFYFSPFIGYSKWRLMSVSADSITSIEVGELKIERDKFGKWTNLSTFREMGVPINQINNVLDEYVPIKRIKFSLKTRQGDFNFLIGRKNANFLNLLRSVTGLE